jgi:CheY-like chemotaxis protein
MMGSRLEVESTYGKGSTFSFTVMQQIADETPIGDYAQRLDLSRRAVANEILRAENARVLVVDDNEMNLKVAKNLLKLFGIVPDLADSGFEAIELMRKERYNIVFLDHMMPKMDGVETLRLLKKEQLVPDDTKVIVLTANAVLGAKEQYLEEGFDDYLSKPIDVSRLEELLIRVLPQELYTLRTAENAEESAGSESSAVDELQKAGFDTAAGLRFAAGDRDFYLELASGFAESAEKNLPQIRADFEKRDYEDYQIRVHALKSTARQIGANELSELALRQETAAKERNISEIEKGTENLLLKYEQTVKLLRDILHLDVSEPVPEEAKETISADDLRKKLGEARACIENFEAESALEILKPLASHSFADSAVGDALRKIIDALEDFDTFTAEEGINAIMERVEK